MTDLRKAAEMALEALEKLTDGRIFTADLAGYYGAAKNTLRQALAQPEQEPVAWLVSDAQGRYATIRDPAPYGEEVYEPLYAAPFKREWVGLRDIDIHVLKMNHDKVKVVHTDRAEDLTVLGQDVDVNGLINAIQTKLKELNT